MINFFDTFDHNFTKLLYQYHHNGIIIHLILKMCKFLNLKYKNPHLPWISQENDPSGKDTWYKEQQI